MFRVFLSLLVMTPCLLRAVIIDQIAIIVDNSIVKDSDIARDLRVTDFLNGDPLDLSGKARKVAASRLIDQIFIRKEIEIGDYPVASPHEADEELDSLVKQKFKTELAFQDALRRYGIMAPDLRSHFLWQLTVLRFIDTRFKPAVLVTDQDVEKYYQEHAASLRREHPAHSSLDELRQEIENLLAGQQVNKIFFSWLDEQRKQAKIKYLEVSLQ